MAFFLLQLISAQIHFALEGLVAAQMAPISAEPLSYCLYHSIIWTFLADLLTGGNLIAYSAFHVPATGQKGAKP